MPFGRPYVDGSVLARVFLNDVALLDGHDRSSRGECSILPEDDMQRVVAELLALTVPPTDKAKTPRADLRGSILPALSPVAQR
jgi:hypothetical protein